jgi:hypothetical protein
MKKETLDILQFVIPAGTVIVGFIITYLGTKHRIKIEFSQHREKIDAERKRQREEVVRRKAEETYITIQNILDTAHSIEREVAHLISGPKWSAEQLQTAYWRLIKPTDRLRMLLSLYFPRLLKKFSKLWVAAYNLVYALRAFAVQHTVFESGGFRFEGAFLDAQAERTNIDYKAFTEHFDQNIEKLNSLLDQFAKELNKSITAEDFL